MKYLTLIFFFVIAAASVQANACTSYSPSVTPASTSRTLASGSARQFPHISVELYCNAGETYSITSSATQFNATIGTVANTIHITLQDNAACTYPLHTRPVTGTAATTGVVTVNLCVILFGSGAGQTIVGLGAYSVSTDIIISSSGGSPFTYYYTELGTVSATCAAGNATANFGSIPLVAHPIVPISVSITCTNTVPYTISQLVGGSVTIGGAANTAWLFSDSGGTIPINTTPIHVTGTGMAQNQTLYVGLSGITNISSPIAGIGTVTGSVQYIVTY